LNLYFRRNFTKAIKSLIFNISMVSYPEPFQAMKPENNYLN